MTDLTGKTKPVVEIKTVEEFTKAFGGLSALMPKVELQVKNFIKYGNSFTRVGAETLEDYDRKVGDRVKFSPGDEPEDYDGTGFLPGDVGTVVGIDNDGIVVRWDRLGRDRSVYNGELDDLGILEELADLASHKESFPMVKRVN